MNPPNYPATVMKVKRGGVFLMAVEVEYEGFDFTGVTVTAQLRDQPGGNLVQGLAVVGVNTATVGKLVFQLTADAQQTAAWCLGLLVGDIALTKASVGWGPYYSGNFLVDVEERVTT